MSGIPQKDLFGCSVACVAKAAGICYDEALLLFNNPDLAKNRGFSCKEIVSALKKTDFKCFTVRVRSNRLNFKSKSIVFIERNKVYPCGHFLIKIGIKWMDPWINYPKFPIMSGYRKNLPGRVIFLITK